MQELQVADRQPPKGPLMSTPTERPWKLLWYGTEQYPYPLSIKVPVPQ